MFLKKSLWNREIALHYIAVDFLATYSVGLYAVKFSTFNITLIYLLFLPKAILLTLMKVFLAQQ